MFRHDPEATASIYHGRRTAVSLLQHAVDNESVKFNINGYLSPTFSIRFSKSLSQGTTATRLQIWSQLQSTKESKV